MSMVTWLNRLNSPRPRPVGRNPSRDDIRAYALALAELRKQLPADDPALRSEVDAALFSSQLEAQAEHYREKLAVAWTVAGCLGVVLLVVAWP